MVECEDVVAVEHSDGFGVDAAVGAEDGGVEGEVESGIRGSCRDLRRADQGAVRVNRVWGTEEQVVNF